MSGWILMLATHLAFSAAGCTTDVTSGPQSAEFSGTTMGTRYSIKCWRSHDVTDQAILQGKIDHLLKQINQQMSTYLPDSELSQFNAAPADKWFAVSDATAFVAERAVHYYRLTDGASDVTVGPLVKLWDFGPGRRSLDAKYSAPSQEVLIEGLKLTGCHHLKTRLDPPALKKTLPALQVDLSSIAKGYAVDAVADLLREHGFTNSMVEIGGEVHARGTRQDGQLWRIGLEAPDRQQRSIHLVISLHDQALATSGDYRNFREIEGEKVSHIIDPVTGRALPYRGWSVTVLAPTCLEADALATALLVMGEDRGYDWCKEQHVAALFLIGQDSEVVEKATPAFLEFADFLVRDPLR